MKKYLILLGASGFVLFLMYWVLSHSFLIVPVLPIFAVLALAFVVLFLWATKRRP